MQETRNFTPCESIASFSFASEVFFSMANERIIWSNPSQFTPLDFVFASVSTYNILHARREWGKKVHKQRRYTSNV
jgi:hypothetical protein